MKRNLVQLSKHSYDVAVIGGGIYGVCVAWDAALRGLSVALVEKGDFGHATSSNTLRIIHGGLRYLQHGDIRRLRQSTHERMVFMRIAPHLVHPLPFLIPAYGHGIRGKTALSVAASLYDLIAFDRNRLNDPQKYLPRGRIVSKEECLRLFPGVDKEGLTGGAIIHDCQMYSSERLILSFVRSAAETGADVANYVEVGGLAKEGAAVTAIKARDVLTGEQFDIRAKVLVNTSGPWLDRVLGLLNGHRPSRKLVLSKAFNLLLKRQLVPEYAVGIYAKTQFKDRDAILRKGYRAYFVTPWRHRSLIGTVHLPYESDPDHLEINETEIQDFLDEINQALPSASVTRQDICFVYKGLLPADSDRRDGIQLVKNHRLHDHDKEDGIGGLISVTGVKFTEARYVAEKTVDLVFRKLGQSPPKSSTVETPLYGGHIEQFQPFLARETERRPRLLNADAIQHLVYNYGSAYPGVLKYLDGDCRCSNTFPDMSRLLRAEVLHAIEEEMAQKLADVIFRRTALGIDGNVGDACLETCAAIMANKLGWDTTRTQSELEEVRSTLALKS